MSPLYWLALTATMTALLWIPYVLDRFFTVGIWRTMDNPTPEAEGRQSPWAMRARRAHANAVENLVVFAALLLVAQHMGLAEHAWVKSAAPLYFFARLVHYVVFAAGVPGLRTAAFIAGFAAQLAIAIVVLAR